MKKEILILCCLFAALLTGCKNDEPVEPPPPPTPVNGRLTLHLKTPGTLHTVISESDKYEITSLTLTGNLNGTDIRFIREMAGSNEYGNEILFLLGKLAALDLSGANIVEGGEAYIYQNQVAYYTSAKEIGSYMFYSCANLTSIAINKNITSIRSCAFSNCKGLTSITIPDGVTSIGFIAFGYSPNLTSITIPNSVTSIGLYTFAECKGLTSVAIGKNVASIGFRAFYSCTSLKEVYSANPVPPSCDDDSFYLVDKTNCTLYVPVGSRKAYQADEKWKGFENIVEKKMP